MKTISLVIALLLPTAAFGAGLPPWQFGMTKQQVASFKQFAPYKSFKNGDLETYSGIYRGHKENVQFFFINGRLARIGVYLWEGQNRDRAIKEAIRAYYILEKDYGKVRIPEMKVAAGSKPVDTNAMVIGAVVHAGVLGKSHIVPVRQPRGFRVSGSIFGFPAREGFTFAVAVMFDPA